MRPYRHLSGRRVVLVMGVMAAAWTCGSEARPSPRLAVSCPADARLLALVLVDSTTLAETDSVFLGTPGAAFTAAPEGTLYIPDPSTNRILVYARTGELMRTIGRTGGGPGEFAQIGTFGVATESVIVQDDGGAKRLNVFDRRSGNFRRSVPYRGYLSWVARSPDDYVLGLVDHQSAMALATVSVSDFESGVASVAKDPIISSEIALPAEYSEYHMLKAWADAKALRIGDTVLVAFGGLDYVVRVSAPGAYADTLHVPACARRGTRPEKLERWFRRVPQSYEDVAEISQHTDSALSALLGIWGLPDGRFVVWYQDPTWESGGKILKGIAYLALLSPDLSQACVDGRVEAPGIDRVRLTIHADTVLVLDQVVGEGPRAGVKSVVRRYRFDDRDCSWLSTKSQK
jgi:hypothetical protein